MYVRIQYYGLTTDPKLRLMFPNTYLICDCVVHVLCVHSDDYFVKMDDGTEVRVVCPMSEPL